MDCEPSCCDSEIVSCDGGVVDVIDKKERGKNQGEAENDNQLTCVMKFGGSSVALAEMMREVADLILSLLQERPVIVLSAMGKTTNKLLLAGEKVVRCGVVNVSTLDELHQELAFQDYSRAWSVRLYHFITPGGAGTTSQGNCYDERDDSTEKDYLVSFGECTSTWLFAAYLNKIRVKARQTLRFPSMWIQPLKSDKPKFDALVV